MGPIGPISHQNLCYGMLTQLTRGGFSSESIVVVLELLLQLCEYLG